MGYTASAWPGIRPATGDRIDRPFAHGAEVVDTVLRSDPVLAVAASAGCWKVIPDEAANVASATSCTTVAIRATRPLLARVFIPIASLVSPLTGLTGSVVRCHVLSLQRCSSGLERCV